MSTMDCVDNVVGMIATFSPKGNLFECMNVRTPEDFWKIMRARTDPLKYRVCTAPASEGNIDSCIKKFGEDKLSEIFVRYTWDIRDPGIRKWMYWIFDNPVKETEGTFSISQLRASAKSKKPKVTNCFSNESGTLKTLYSLEEFTKYLTTIPADSKIEWLLNTYHPIIYGFPNDIGREFILREGCWSLNPTPVSNVSYTYVEVEAIGSHASTWSSTFPNPIIEGELGSGTHTSALMNDGITIVVKNKEAQKVTGYNWYPNINCLFANLFNGKFHEFRKVRETYQTKTKIINQNVNPYKGAFIPREHNSKTGKYFEYGTYNSSINKKVIKFKINDVVYEVY